MKNRAIAFPMLALILLSFNGCKDEQVETCDSSGIVADIASSTLPSACDANDVSVSFAITGGTGPYRYFLNTGSTTISQSNSDFTNLFPGFMELTVLDNNNCSASLEFSIFNETPSGKSYTTDIKPILEANCNIPSCHNGDLGVDRDWRSITNIQNKLNNFQRVLDLNKMPPPPNAQLSSQEKSAILCWIADCGLNN